MRLKSWTVYLGNFLRALGVYLPYLIFSTYLSQFVPEKQVGLVFTVAAILSGTVLLLTPRIFKLLRTHRTLIVAAIVAASALIGLSFAKSAPSAIPLFLIAWVFGWIVAFALDVILEKVVGSAEASTGTSRAIFLTASNTAVVLSSLILAVTLTNGDYWRVFLIAAGAFSVLAYLGIRYYGSIPHVPTSTTSIVATTRRILNNPSLAAVMGAQFMLQLIFVWSAIYIPLYLHNHSGLEWSAIGTIFAIATFSFVVVQIPVGRLADEKYGEKEFIIAGILLSGLAFIALTLGSDFGLIWLAIIVLLTQLGAALLEVSAETYFFKQVNASDSQLIGLFRALRQGATIIGPLIGSLALFVVPFEYVFAIFGIVLMICIYPMLQMKDTK